MEKNQRKIPSILIIYMIICALFLISIRPMGQIIINSTYISSAKETFSFAYDKAIKEYNSFNADPQALTPMTLYRPNEKEIELYSLLSDKNILVTKFIKKDWGTWNINGWFLANDGAIPTKDPYLLAGGGSDWEYVFRVAEIPNVNYIFSGGNHGKELLKDIKFINGDNNTELNLDIDQKLTLRTLKIVEKTTLTTDDRMAKDYANVTRNYTITHGQIDLATEFKFTTFIFMGTSYVCMMPVEKKTGRFIKFNDANIIYTSPDVGDTYSSYTYDNILGKEKTLSADIWGTYTPKYRFNCWINNSQMVDNFDNQLKIFYWDLNRAGNKLYFSKFDNNLVNRIDEGTIWNNLQGWKLEVK